MTIGRRAVIAWVRRLTGAGRIDGRRVGAGRVTVADTLFIMRWWLDREYPFVYHLHLYSDGTGCAVVASGFTLDGEEVLVVFDGPVGAVLRDACDAVWSVLPACVNADTGEVRLPG